MARVLDDNVGNIRKSCLGPMPLVSYPCIWKNREKNSSVQEFGTNRQELVTGNGVTSEKIPGT